jgi:hypothetical protein
MKMQNKAKMLHFRPKNKDFQENKPKSNPFSPETLLLEASDKRIPVFYIEKIRFSATMITLLKRLA